MSVWMTGLFLMTWVFIRDQGFRQFDPQLEISVLGLFWVFGIGGCGYFFNQPCTSLDIQPDLINLTEYWIWTKNQHRLQRKDIQEISSATVRDSDGDIYQLWIITAKNRFLIQQSGIFSDIQKLEKQLQSLL